MKQACKCIVLKTFLALRGTHEKTEPSTGPCFSIPAAGEQDATVGCSVLVPSARLVTYHTALSKETCKNTSPGAGSVAQAKLSPGQM